MSRNEIKQKKEEKFIFQKFINYLYKCEGYNKSFFEDINDIYHPDDPDFEIHLQTNKKIIGIELTSYYLDAMRKNKKKKSIIFSKLNEQFHRDKDKDNPKYHGGYYNPASGLYAIIQNKDINTNKTYISENWLIIHSNNTNHQQFVGDSLTPEITQHKCNEAMKNINHSYNKIFLFCYEHNNEWICDLSKDSKILKEINF